MGYTLDIVLVAVCVAFVAIGAHRGFIRSAAHFLGAVVAASLAGLLGGAAAQWVFDTLFRPGLVERIGESLASLGSGDTYTAVQGVFASLPDFILVFVIIAEVILHQRHEQVIGNLHIFHSLPFLSATAATIATVVWAAAFSPLQPSLPSRPSSTTSKAGASTSI